MKLTDAFGNEIVVGSILLVPTFARRRGQANRPAVVTKIEYNSGCHYCSIAYVWVLEQGYTNSGHVERNVRGKSSVDGVYVLEMNQVRQLTEKTADALNVISLYWHAKRELNQKMEELRAAKATA